MRSSLSLTAAVLVTLIFAAASGPHQQARAQTATVIEVGDFWFCDSSFQNGVCETTVSVGDTVQWQCVGSGSHTTTECGGDLDACSQPHLWDSPVQTSGGTFSFAFDSAGSFVYRCQVHPSVMRGRVTVIGGQPTATPSATPTPSPEPSAAATPTPSSAEPVEAGSPAPMPVVVPAAGGPSAGGQGTPVPWWLALVTGGGFLMCAATALVVWGRLGAAGGGARRGR